MGSDKTDAVFSYHTFILPFSWITSGDYYRKFVKYFETNENWICTDMDDTNDINSVETVSEEKDKLLLYKEYQYFYPYARKAIYGFDEKIVRNFNFMHEQLHNKATFTIKKNDKCYILNINEIRLKIYNTGVALFIMECENTSHRDIEAVKDINDYGRRITLPFIPEHPEDSIAADSLTIKISDAIEFSSDFKEYIENKQKNISMNHIADYIKDLLDYGGIKEKAFSSRRVDDPDRFRISPLLGDRMFVMTMIPNSDWLIEEKKKGIYSDSVYELVFVDHSDGYSCANDEMRDDLIDESLYKRWIDYKDCPSYYFITNYSFIFVTKSNYEGFLENFLTQYYQMYCLALAQRASISSFKKQIAAVASLFGDSAKIGDQKKYMNDITKITEQYIAFESQLFFDEVSPEQQGIEVYDLIKARLRLKEEISTLKEQIDSLYNVANIRNETRSNNWMESLTWIAFWVSIASMVISAFQINEFKGLYFKNIEELNPLGKSDAFIVAMIISGVLFFAVIVTVICLHIARNRNRKNC